MTWRAVVTCPACCANAEAEAETPDEATDTALARLCEMGHHERALLSLAVTDSAARRLAGYERKFAR